MNKSINVSKIKKCYVSSEKNIAFKNMCMMGNMEEIYKFFDGQRYSRHSIQKGIEGACIGGHLVIIELLIKLVKKTNLSFSFWKHVLHIAIKNNHPRIINFIIDIIRHLNPFENIFELSFHLSYKYNRFECLYAINVPKDFFDNEDDIVWWFGNMMAIDYNCKKICHMIKFLFHHLKPNYFFTKNLKINCMKEAIDIGQTRVAIILYYMISGKVSQKHSLCSRMIQSKQDMQELMDGTQGKFLSLFDCTEQEKCLSFFNGMKYYKD